MGFKYKVGDRVVIREGLGNHGVVIREGLGNHENSISNIRFMNQYECEIMTIRSVTEHAYKMQEDKDIVHDGFDWNEDMIDHKATKELQEEESCLEFKDLEEGKEYIEITEHFDEDCNDYDFKFSLYYGDLYYQDVENSIGLVKETEPLSDILKYRFKEIKKPFPQEYDFYYFVNEFMEVSKDTYHGCIPSGGTKLKIGNMFKDRESAEKKLKQIKKILKEDN